MSKDKLKWKNLPFYERFAKQLKRVEYQKKCVSISVKEGEKRKNNVTDET